MGVRASIANADRHRHGDAVGQRSRRAAAVDGGGAPRAAALVLAHEQPHGRAARQPVRHTRSISQESQPRCVCGTVAVSLGSLSPLPLPHPPRTPSLTPPRVTDRRRMGQMGANPMGAPPNVQRASLTPHFAESHTALAAEAAGRLLDEHSRRTCDLSLSPLHFLPSF